MLRLVLILAALSAGYTIPGAEVRTDVSCPPYGRVVVYELTATTTSAQRYNLQLDTDAYHIATVGRVAVSGPRLEWLPHRIGDRAVVTVTGGPCDAPVPEVSATWYAYMPVVRR